MSKHQVNHNVQFAASAASCFQPSEGATFRMLSNHVSVPASRMSRNGLLTVTAIFLCGLGVPASAQNPAVTEVASEQGFTIAPNVHTPIVFNAQPDAACDLHPEGVNDAAHSMRLYANADGYVRVHVTAKEESQRDARMQLDCAAGGKVTTHRLHLRAASSPNADMPSPETSVPTPKGTQVLPALTEEAAQKLSDADVIGLGYPSRPDAAASPDQYVKWLGLVSRPITLLPPHSLSRSDISHMPRGVQEGTGTSANWSGYVAQGTTKGYMAVKGEWSVPTAYNGESGYITYSSFWVGLDGYGTKDLVQAGTESDYFDFPPFSFTQYYAWTELLPNQKTAQEASLSINPGDDIYVEVWIGGNTSAAPKDPDGKNAYFYLYNKTQGQSFATVTPLDGTFFNGTSAEWIMERPCLGACGSSLPDFPELSQYGAATMSNAHVLPATGAWIPSGTASNVRITMYENFDLQPDNNKLSSASNLSTDSMFFTWWNFH